MPYDVKYIVLRKLAGKPADTFSPAGGVGTRTSGQKSPLGAPKGLAKSLPEAQAHSLEAAAGLKIETGLDEKNAQEARRDDQTVGVARQMPTMLIRPVAFAEADSAAGQANWGLGEIGALTSPMTGKGVTVAILDTGIDKKHTAFAKMKIVEEDFSGSGNGDLQGHGTHCAGTIFGRDVKGVRIGVAPGVEKALIGKVLGNDGSGDTAMLFSGLEWAINSGADVISMSLGFDFPGHVNRLVNEDGWPVDLATSTALITYRDNLRLFDNLMQRIRFLAPFGQGAVVVAASGNESKADKSPDYRIAVSLPAAADGLVSVGALERAAGGLLVAAFSNTMPRLCAPGVSVWSAKAGTKDQLISMDGTSMACPHVAGVAALWWEKLRKGGKADARSVEARLLASARDGVFLPEVTPLDRGDGLVTAPT